jgi:hypothetical protein
VNFCRPHWERERRKVPALRIVAGDGMCADCISGRSFREEEKRHVPFKVRLKMSAASKRAWADPAVRAKMSAACKRALADPAVRAKMSAARKRALADPAVRAKMSAARKRHHQMLRRAWELLQKEAEGLA